ncbi:ABC transporter substrate-binding protein [Agrobacterium sp. AGB01]|uniref:ABC transporter substrate-binding protein n=1 Tax=Agrobacterium sp. AGB01 TaxID=2769302 RepID=UPI00177F54F4|nr:ABC transporter substrate-binding protein [Agrobacterium sp. AGB01]MBD9388507.1 ABC transporter substrate-binding protein [Agrobacterium sp. AGB01]
MADRIRVTESSPAAKFAPQYVAQELGFFDELDLDVVFNIDAGPAGSWLADNLVQNRADIALGGIWLPFAYHDLNIANLAPVAAVCHRNPAFLVSRRPLECVFDWRVLEGKKVLLSLAATSQWMFLEGVLLEHGVDLSKVKFVRDLHIETMRGLWTSGLGDFFLAEPGTAFAMVEQGATIAATLAEAAGPVPWSVYYARAGDIYPEAPVMRFKSAIEKSVNWILDGNQNDTAKIVARRLGAFDVARMGDIVQHLITSGTWQRSLDIDVEATARYAMMMVNYGLLQNMPDIKSGFAPAI